MLGLVLVIAILIALSVVYPRFAHPSREVIREAVGDPAYVTEVASAQSASDYVLRHSAAIDQGKLANFVRYFLPLITFGAVSLAMLDEGLVPYPSEYPYLLVLWLIHLVVLQRLASDFMPRFLRLDQLRYCQGALEDLDSRDENEGRPRWKPSPSDKMLLSCAGILLLYFVLVELARAGMGFRIGQTVWASIPFLLLTVPRGAILESLREEEEACRREIEGAFHRRSRALGSGNS